MKTPTRHAGFHVIQKPTRPKRKASSVDLHCQGSEAPKNLGSTPKQQDILED